MTARSHKFAASFARVLDDLGSDASRRGYRVDWTAFLAYLKRRKIDVAKATPQDVKRYVGALADGGKAKRTRGRALSVIRRVYGQMVEDELLKVNPAREVRDVRRGKVGKPVTWLEEDALARVLAFGAPIDDKLGKSALAGLSPLQQYGCLLQGLYAARTKGEASEEVEEDFAEKLNDCRHGMGPEDEAVIPQLVASYWFSRRDRMCVQLLAGTGRRRSEIARMRVEDFTDDGVTGVVKGGAEKTAPVPAWLRLELAEWCAFAGITSGPVLPRSPEDPEAVSGDMVYLIVKRVAKAAGIETSPHALRRSLATLANKRGVPLEDIRQQLGHENVLTTTAYLKSSRKVEVAPGEWMGDLVRPKETP